MSATHITRTVAWNSESVYKYKLVLDADFTILGVVGNQVTVNINGTYTVYQSEHDQEMVSAPASDFGFLFFGNVIPAAPTTVIPGDFYEAALPTLFGGDAEQYMSDMLLEFRGDTYQSDGGNFTSLWTRNDGLIINRKFGNTSTTIPINETITVSASGGGVAPVLSWSATYVTFNPTTYHWGESVAWVTIADLDYRPGQTYNNGTWYTHDRAGGAANLYDGGNWQEMRTWNGAAASDNPPLIRHSNGWLNMRRIGAE